MRKKSSSTQPAIKLTGLEKEGLIVATFGAHVEVEDNTGAVFRCYQRKSLAPLITGDRVLWLLEPTGTGMIVDFFPRSAVLSRPLGHRKVKLLAANINALVIVISPVPVVTADVLDRYLVAAENLNIPSIILLNKVDLMPADELAELMTKLQVYADIGIPVIQASTYTDNGLVALEEYLTNKISVLVGPSGVGKSSIIAKLTTVEHIRIGEISATSQLGKHTTTTTRLYHLRLGGKLIDSPGVREFRLWHMSQADILKGFVEFKKFMNKCRFRDCRHHAEPDCAVLAAVANNEISSQRFLSYKKIIAELIDSDSY
jgi:ribosome biogenesis GTPase